MVARGRGKGPGRRPKAVGRGDMAIGASKARGGQGEGIMCEHVPKFRRDACRSCHRKLGEAGLPIGTDGRVAARAVREVFCGR